MTTTPTPLSLYGFLRPKPERADEVRRLLHSLVGPSREHEGNLEYHLHEHDDGRFFLYEVWRSQEDLDRHNAYPPLRAFLDALPEYLAEPVEGWFGTMVSPYPTGDEAWRRPAAGRSSSSRIR
ncbi:putative quinol monooxygenase [Streptomyces capparidis]